MITYTFPVAGRTTNPCFAGVQCRQEIETIAGNGALKVNNVSWDKDGAAAQFIDAGLTVEEAIRKSPEWHQKLRDLFDAETPIEVTLTSDGRHYDRHGWHKGPTAEDVRVERWTPQGMVFHGYIDSVSRHLVQAG